MYTEIYNIMKLALQKWEIDGLSNKFVDTTGQLLRRKDAGPF